MLLEASGDSTWRLQLLGDNHHEAEITAVDEEEAKDAAVVATVALLKEENPEFKEPAKVQFPTTGSIFKDRVLAAAVQTFRQTDG